MRRLDYKSSETAKEIRPFVGGPVRDQLTRENKCKVCTYCFDRCRPLMSGPVPKFHGRVLSDLCLARRDGWKPTAEYWHGRNGQNVSVVSTHTFN